MANAFQAELHQKRLSGSVGDGASGRALAPADFDPANFHQGVNRSLRQRDTANVLNFRTRNRLVIGHDGERLDCREIISAA